MVKDPAAPLFHVGFDDPDSLKTAGAQADKGRKRKGLGRLLDDTDKEEKATFEIED